MSAGEPVFVEVPPGYDPFLQPVNLTAADGMVIPITMGDIDYLRQYGARLSINWGSQLGASIMILLMLLLLTRPDKRRSPIFIINALCLLCNCIRSFLQVRYLTGNYWNFYSLVAADTSRDTDADRANTVTANTFTLIVVMLIFASLSIQVWVVTKTTSTLQRTIIMGVTTVFALAAVAFRFAVTVISNMLVMQRAEYGMRYTEWLFDQMLVMQAVATWMYCTVFTAKLGYALVQRRKLGLSQFGPMQIVFIMAVQTMIFPALFTVLQFYKSVPELGSVSITILCIFPPLSAIWAGVVANDAQLGASSAQRLLQDHFGGNTAIPDTSVSCPTVRTETTYVEGRRKSMGVGMGSFSGGSGGGKEPDSPLTRTDSNGIHMGALKSEKKEEESESQRGIFVEREWVVEEDHQGEGRRRYRDEGEGSAGAWNRV